MRRSAPHPTLACIALGSNLGDRETHLRTALNELSCISGSRLLDQSAFFETPPVGPPQPGYLNAAAALETTLHARELLGHLLAIERGHGRTRDAGHRWGPRTLDLDLLLYGDEVLDEPGLTVPHPRLHERRFVLEPLAQIAPGARIPTLGITVEEALRALAPGAAGALR